MGDLLVSPASREELEEKVNKNYREAEHRNLFTRSRLHLQRVRMIPYQRLMIMG